MKKKKIYKKWWFWLLTGLVVMVSVGGYNIYTIGVKDRAKQADAEAFIKMANQQNMELGKAIAEAKAVTNKFVLTDLKSENDQYTRYATGKIKNNSGGAVGYLQVDVNLYDANGIQVGSTMANVTNVEKDGTWIFKAYITEDKCTDIKVVNIEGN